MRTRKMRLIDYGIPPDDAQLLFARCRMPEYRGKLQKAADESCEPGIVDFMMQSLTAGNSYYALTREIYIPLTRDDFYAYRRKVEARFYDSFDDSNDWKAGDEMDFKTIKAGDILRIKHLERREGDHKAKYYRNWEVKKVYNHHVLCEYKGETESFTYGELLTLGYEHRPKIEADPETAQHYTKENKEEQ